VADVAPFRAIRYAQPTPEVTAPPYDVLTPAERDAYRERDPHNVVHLTLSDSEEDAGLLFRAWLEDGVLRRDEEPAVWAVAQEYVGPDGVARRRGGLVASLRVEPYETGTVLPHERTHAGPKESRLRLLRAARAQLEPIFLLYDGDPPVAVPDREPDLEAGGTRLWRVPADGVAAAFADRQLLIADGHHRYETAVAYAAEQATPESARMMVVLVSTSDPGLEIFPTHRLFRGHADALPALAAGDPTPLPLSSGSPGCPTTVRGPSATAGAPPSPSSASRASSTSSSSTGSSGTRGSATPPTSPRRWPGSTQASSTGPSSCGRRGSRTCSSAPAAAR
jgi:hypothetical protein